MCFEQCGYAFFFSLPGGRVSVIRRFMTSLRALPLRNPGLKSKEVSELQHIQAFASLLQNSRDFFTASLAHFLISHAGYRGNRFLANLLIELYGKCGALQDALSTFHSLDRKNVFTWNIFISVLVHHAHPCQALQLFHQMLAEGIVPDTFTFSVVVDACALMETLVEGHLVNCMLAHNHMDSDAVVATSLINMYSSHSQLPLAKHVFDQVREHDSVSWSALIEAYAKHGFEKTLVQLFQHMQCERVKPVSVALLAVLGACATICTLTWGELFHSITIDVGLENDLSVGNALLNLYAKCGNLEDGLCVFQKMQLRDVISWTAMISAYTQVGSVQKALQLFSEMQADGAQPNEITFVNILSACSHEGMVEEGLYYFLSIFNNHFMTPTTQHYGCLIDLFGRVGQLEEADVFLSNTDARHNAVIWQALLRACKSHNDMERGKRVAECIIHLDPSLSAPYVALSDFYAVC